MLNFRCLFWMVMVTALMATFSNGQIVTKKEINYVKYNYREKTYYLIIRAKGVQYTMGKKAIRIALDDGNYIEFSPERPSSVTVISRTKSDRLLVESLPSKKAEKKGLSLKLKFIPLTELKK